MTGTIDLTFDSGWQCTDACRHIRGWCRQHRELKVSPSTPLALVNAWIDAEQAGFCGQTFTSSLLPSGDIELVRAVDSGD